MNNINITTATNDKFNRSTVDSKSAIISSNKIEVALERYSNIKGTELDSLLKRFVSIIAEADRHIANGDEFFEYRIDKIDARARLDMLISNIYRNEGNIDKICNDVCYKNGKVEAVELSDHYWACK